MSKRRNTQNLVRRRSNNIPKPYKSRFEYNVSEFLKGYGVSVKYEEKSLDFVQPEKKRVYTPDFELPNGIFLEIKGRLTLDDRQKHMWVRDSNPEVDIRFVFMNANAKISKNSKTTYRMWCDKNGFQWADKTVPLKWIRE